jgi:hypothetical protein
MHPGRSGSDDCSSRPTDWISSASTRRAHTPESADGPVGQGLNKPQVSFAGAATPCGCCSWRRSSSVRRGIDRPDRTWSCDWDAVRQVTIAWAKKSAMILDADRDSPRAYYSREECLVKEALTPPGFEHAREARLRLAACTRDCRPEFTGAHWAPTRTRACSRVLATRGVP